MAKIYERREAVEFYKHFGLTTDETDSDLIYFPNTDGVVRGNLIEFKIERLTQKHLCQAVVYANRIRNEGKLLPANILLINLLEHEVEVYKTKDLLKYIEKKNEINAASKTGNFIKENIAPDESFKFKSLDGRNRLGALLATEKYTKYHVDFWNAVGLSIEFYKLSGNFTDSKIAFNKEIRNPAKLADRILPYKATERDNTEFQAILDILNPKVLQKELGAFYTPPPYCEKATELVRKAINIVPKGNDYIIFDRCAGSGNLEQFFTDEELKHCILATYEIIEYTQLVNRYEGRVRYIIPPPDKVKVENPTGKVSGGNALEKYFVENKEIKKYINNPKYTIIIYENPPSRDSGADKGQNKENSSNKSYIHSEMKKDSRGKPYEGRPCNDLVNQFIWSAFQYYIRQPTDSYIVYSPVKYFKAQGIVNKLFKKGFAFNRKHFHASASTYSCIWWQNKPEMKDSWKLKCYDIKDDKLQEIEQDFIEIKRCHKLMSSFNKNNKNLTKENSIAEYFCEGWVLRLQGIGFANVGCLKGGSPTLLGKDNYLEKLPLFCAKLYPQQNWYEHNVYFTTADGGGKYLEDSEFLKACFIYTCLHKSNHCISDSLHKNELCFDMDTIASKQLARYSDFDDDEEELKIAWRKILKDAKSTTEYNPVFKYGVYQIYEEINVLDTETYKDGKDDNGRNVYKYPKLNEKLGNLQKLLKEYYETHIQEKLFKYELLK